MTHDWGDVNARARGLASRLLSTEALAVVAASPTFETLATRLAERGLPVDPGGASTRTGLDRACRAWGDGLLRELERWMGDRSPWLRVAFEEEDRRSLRALLRGAAQGAPTEQRLLGLIPSRRLPSARLRRLAELGSVPEVLAELESGGWSLPVPARTAWRGPTDFWELECGLDREFATRALEGTRRGGRELRLFVRETLDLRNAWTALAAVPSGHDLSPDVVFLPGGVSLDRTRFEAALAAGSPPRVRRMLASALGRSGPGVPFLTDAPDGEDLQRAALRGREEALARRARLRPLGPAPTLHFVVRLEAQRRDLCRLIWESALGADSRVGVPGGVAA